MIEVVLFIAGIALGVAVNYAIYAFAYFPRPISPWQRRPEELSPVHPLARLPIAGWLLRFSDSVLWGRGFWIRPLLIELATPFLWVWLYRAIMSGLTVPLAVRGPVQGGVIAGMGVSSLELHVQFAAYSILFALMAVAMFIDIDERTIPDWVTVPGTWIGLLGAALLPGWTLWEAKRAGAPTFSWTMIPLQANSPYAWLTAWDQVGFTGLGLWLALLIWLIWCCSLGNLRWITRRGFAKAFTYFWVGFLRSPNLPLVLGMAVVGSALIVASYTYLPADRWRALFSSFMGVGLGGCLVWSFRIVSGFVLRQEALGFGDVTLLAMVGAFFGWQIVLIAFFLAPLFGIVLVVIYWVITRDGAIPFGPYLAAATAYLLLDWPRVWDAVSITFLPVNAYLLFLGGLLSVLGSLLWVVRWFKLLFTVNDGNVQKR